MNNEINYKNNPLNGVSLKAMLNELVTHYGFGILSAYLKINCFKTNPSIESSAKFLKKTQWAREKVEVFYLYKFKNLPRVSSEQFGISPRDRIIPDDQKSGEPAELSLDDAEQMYKKIAERVAEKKQSGRQHSHSRKDFAAQREKHSSNDQNYTDKRKDKSTKSSKATPVDGEDPWAKWR
ncbi:MAG: DUF2132 domain-containing protein [Gammaproteobacteria bacterium]|nr:DUF2132 domain-containing protein [Gammaproteobacteria bacterium]